MFEILGEVGRMTSELAHALQRAAHARVVRKPFPARLLDGNIQEGQRQRAASLSTGSTLGEIDSPGYCTPAS